MASSPGRFFVFPIHAWPEIVVPAYFVARGARLYDSIFFPHTPLLILTIALGGKLFGFSSLLFKGIVGTSMAATGALLVAGVRPGERRGTARAIGLAIGIPLYVLLSLATDGPTLWPEPFLVPLVLGAALALEKYEKAGRDQSLVLAAVLLGLAILVKQTAAWMLLAAVAWTLSSGGRRRLRGGLLVAALGALPYLAFLLGWGAWFRTTAHFRWTFLIPLFGGFARDIGRGVDLPTMLDGLILFAVLPAIGLIRSSVPSSGTSGSPAIWLALSAIGMAWPRWGVPHLASAIGLLALLATRSLVVASIALRRGARAARSLRIATGGRPASPGRSPFGGTPSGNSRSRRVSDAPDLRRGSFDDRHAHPLPSLRRRIRPGLGNTGLGDGSRGVDGRRETAGIASGSGSSRRSGLRRPGAQGGLAPIRRRRSRRVRIDCPVEGDRPGECRTR